MEGYETPPADIYAVYPDRHNLSPKVQAFVNFMAASFREMGEGAAGAHPVW